MSEVLYTRQSVEEALRRAVQEGLISAWEPGDSGAAREGCWSAEVWEPAYPMHTVELRSLREAWVFLSGISVARWAQERKESRKRDREFSTTP